MGRETEIRQLESLAQEHRLVTVTGVRGIGKTALVRALLGWLDGDAQRPFERTVLVSAGGAGNPQDLATEVANALGGDEVGEATAGRRVLVAIDDVEGLLEADRAGLRALFDRWLGGAPGLHLVVLSRELVGSLFEASEHELRLGALSVAASRELFGAVAWGDARATGGNDPTLTPLLEWLGGHPLALRLVGTEARSWPLDALLHRLEATDEAAPQPTAALAEEPLRRNAEPTLARRLSASLAFSLGRLEDLDATATELFAWLSVFPRGLPVSLAPALFGDSAWDAAALLATRGLAVDGDEAARITLRPSLANLARTHQRGLTRSRRQALTRRSLGATAGLFAATATRTHPVEVRRAHASLARDEGALAEIVALLDELPPGSDSEGRSDAASLSRALRSYVDLCVAANRARLAEPVVRRALDFVLAHGAPEAVADAALAAARIYQHIDRLAEAEELLRRADAAREALGDASGRLVIAESLAVIAMRSERWDDAESALLDLCARHEASHDLAGQARVHRLLGDLARKRGRSEEAAHAYRRAIPLQRGILDTFGEAETLLALGDTSRANDPWASELAYRSAAEVARAAGARAIEASALSALGQGLAQRDGKQAESARVLAECLSIVRELRDAAGEATALSALGDALIAAGEPADAFLRGREALAIRRRLGDSVGIASCYGLLSRAALAYGEPGRAVVLAGQAHRIRAAMSDRAGEIVALQEVARALGRVGRADAESAAMLVAWTAAHAIGHPFATHMRRATGVATPPEGLALEAQVTLTAAISDCEAELYEGGRDADSPLGSDEES